MEKKMEFGLGFWTNRAGHAVTHNKGMTEEQIAFLQSFVVGDKFVMFKNDKKITENSPDYTLKKSIMINYTVNEMQVKTQKEETINA